MASSIQIEIDTGKVRQNASEIAKQAQDYNKLQQDLFNEGRDLDKTWDGDANQSFNARLKNDEPRFGELYKIINEYVGAVNDSATDYDKTEAAVAAEMSANSKRQSR